MLHKCTGQLYLYSVTYLDLKRFSEARRTSKLSTFVNFPMKDLDLREFSSENSSKVSLWQTTYSEADSTSMKDNFCCGFLNFHFSLFVSLFAANAVYNLYAVSNHSGTTMGGHYTAYCRNPSSGEWYTFNDSRYVHTLFKLHNLWICAEANWFLLMSHGLRCFSNFIFLLHLHP